MEEREKIRQLVEEGRCMEAVEHVRALMPFVFTDAPALYFLVVKHDILESMYVQNMPECAAIQRVQKELVGIVERNLSLIEEMETLLGCIVFRTLDKSAVIDARWSVYSAINTQMVVAADCEIKNKMLASIEKMQTIQKTAQMPAVKHACMYIESELQSTK